MHSSLTVLNVCILLLAVTVAIKCFPTISGAHQNTLENIPIIYTLYVAELSVLAWH